MIGAYVLRVLLALLAAGLLLVGARGAVSAPTSPTGISYVDEVIAAAISGDSQAFKRLVVFSTVPCTPEKWLFRQPLCAEGEAAGTPVKTLPILSSDLGHMRADQVTEWAGMQHDRLYAVYRTSDYTYADEYYPKGEYAVAFLLPGSEFAFIFQVTRAGIVRVDYCGVRLDICNGSTIAEVQRDHPEAFVLGPLDE